MKTTTSTVSIDAPQEIVWTVLTEPRYVKLWQYGSDLVTDWAVGSPIRFSSEWEGTTFEQWGTVMSFEPPSRLSYTLFAPRPDLTDVPENYFTMIYELVDADGGSVVSFIHQDPRVIDDVAETAGESPILEALRALAESI